MIDIDKIEEAANRHGNDADWQGASIAYGTHVTPNVVLEMVSLIRLQEAGLNAEQARYESLAQEMTRKIGQLQEVLRVTDIEINYRQDGTLDWKRVCQIPAQTGMLPAWIDAMKGKDPTMDSVIEYIEQLRTAQPVQQPAPVVKNEATTITEDERDAITDLRSAVKDGATAGWILGFVRQYPFAAPVAAPVDVPAASVQPDEPPLTELENQIADLFGIGSEARLNRDTIFTNVKNTSHFAELLHAVEREFFMVPDEPDDEYPDEQPEKVCLVNSWGCTSTEQYIEQVRIALAQLQPDSGRDAALVADAERYRWLRSVGKEQQNVIGHYAAGEMDVQIDKFLAAHPANVAQPVSGAALVGYVDADAVAQAKGGKDAKVTIYTLPRLAAGLDVAIYTTPPASVAQVGELSDAQIAVLIGKHNKAEPRNDGDGTYYVQVFQKEKFARAIIAAMSAPAKTDKGSAS